MSIKVFKTDLDCKTKKSSRRSIKNIKKNSEIGANANNKIQNNNEICKFKNYIIIIILLISLVLILFLLIYFLVLKKSYIASSKRERIIISISDLNFEEAESLIDSKTIEENHILLNETIENINNLLIICDNTSLEIPGINPNISFSLPDFLKNSTTRALKMIKSDVELYKKII